MAKKTPRKLKDYETLVPSRVIVDYDRLDGRPFTELSRAEKIQLVGSDITRKVVLRTDGGSVYYGVYIVSVKRNGNRIFTHTDGSTFIFLKPRGGRIQNASSNDIRDFLKLMGIAWAKDIAERNEYAYPLSKVSVLKSILTGSIHSEETFWKFVSRRLYGVKDVNWKVFRDYYIGLNHYNFRTPIGDLRDFTADTENSMHRILALKDQEDISLVEDVVASAVKLDERVNVGKWSINRINEHHRSQVVRLTESTLPDDAEAPFYSEAEFKDAEGVRLLGSVRDVFEEGASMGHCLYTNYLSDIQKGKELAFHLSGDEECTFAVQKKRFVRYANSGPQVVVSDEMELQQAYMSYNRPISETTRQRILSFISANMERMRNLLNERRKAYGATLALTTGGEAPVDYDPEDDLPF